MSRNGYEVAIHECPVLGKKIDFGSLSFLKLWVCKYCGEELNAALDSKNFRISDKSDKLVNRENKNTQ